MTSLLNDRRPGRRPGAPRTPGRALPARRGGAFALLAGGALLATLGACKDTTGLRATFTNATDTLTVYALSDTTTARRDYPTAVITGSRTTNASGVVVANPFVVPVASSAEFDVAFDIDASGKVVLYPQRRVVVPITGGRRVGLQLLSGSFDAVTEAPSNGYKYDSVAVTVEPGQVVAIQASTTQCSVELSPYTYSKLVVDSVVPALQAIYFRIATDPNCGFRSFAPGIPSR